MAEFGKEGGDFALDGDRICNTGSMMYTFSGVSMYRPAFFDGREPGRFSVVPMLRAAADERRVCGSVYAGFWKDVGTPERLAELNV